MKNEKLKDCLDDALSGIGGDPWLTGKVLSRAERREDRPVRKAFSRGTVLIVLAVVLLMSAGIAAVTAGDWNVLDFLGEWGKNTAVTPSPVEQQAETEHALLRVDSAVYDGGVLAFDWTIMNKNPEVPMWCHVETFTINGKGYESELINDSYISNCGDEWLPDYSYPDGTAHCGEFVPLSYGIAGQETARVELRVKTFRPRRPVAMINTEQSFREELEQKIAQGFYAIPADSWGDGELWPDGWFEPEEDPEACPEGWAVAVSGEPLTRIMGGMTVETLEIRFDVARQEQGGETVYLQAQEVYENEYCTAVYEQADVSSLGLYLTLRVNPKNEISRRAETARLTDAEGSALAGIRFYPTEKMTFDSEEHKGERIWRYQWSMVRPEDLPDTVCLTIRLENGEDMLFPIKVR